MISELREQSRVFTVPYLEELIAIYDDILKSSNDEEVPPFEFISLMCKLSRKAVLVYQKLWYQRHRNMDVLGDELVSLQARSIDVIERLGEKIVDPTEQRLSASYQEHIENRISWISTSNDENVSIDERVARLFSIEVDSDNC